MSLQAALLPPHTAYTLYHTKTQSYSFCDPVTEDGSKRERRMKKHVNRYLEKTNKECVCVSSCEPLIKLNTVTTFKNVGNCFK